MNIVSLKCREGGGGLRGGPDEKELEEGSEGGDRPRVLLPSTATANTKPTTVSPSVCLADSTTAHHRHPVSTCGMVNQMSAAFFGMRPGAKRGGGKDAWVQKGPVLPLTSAMLCCDEHEARRI
ncbi:unnamed protein product [Boreogadus saida]